MTCSNCEAHNEKVMADAGNFSHAKDILLALEFDAKDANQIAEETNRVTYAAWSMMSLMYFNGLIQLNVGLTAYTLTQHGKNVLTVMDAPIRFRFKSLGAFTITESGEFFTVANPLLCNDFFWLNNETVRIDGVKYIVKKVIHMGGIETSYDVGKIITLNVDKVVE
jgi:hypothetical protein